MRRALGRIDAGGDRSATTALLEGDLQLGEVRSGELFGWLLPCDGTFSRTRSFRNANPGPFHAAGDQPGSYDLHLQFVRGAASLWIDERLQLAAGENTWTCAFETGELVIANALESAANLELRCDLGGSRRVSLTLQLAPGSEQRLSGVPAGKWLRWESRGRVLHAEDAVVVQAGGSARYTAR